MKFNSWTTDYEGYRRFMGRQADPYEVFVRQRAKEFERMGTPAFRLTMETYWYADGKPYYNVHPQLVPKLARINLEKIPANLIVVPDPFITVHVALAEDHPELTMTEEVPVQGYRSKNIPAGTAVKGILMSDRRAMSDRHRSDYILFCLDFGVYNEFQQPTYLIFSLNLEEGQSLAEALESCLDDERSDNYRTVCANALRLATTIGFLANSKSELIEPDVLSKCRQQYERGDEDTRKRIVEKSHRKGKLGYNVGNDLMFLGPQSTRSGGPKGTGEGRELQWQHLRGGHPHPVRYGEGKRLVKIMWFQPTQVRPDLPFKPESEQ